MIKFAVFVLALAAVSNAGLLANIGDIIGGPIGGIITGKVEMEKLQGVLQQANADGNVKSIDQVRIQIVAGVRYIVNYTTADDKKCSAIWVEQVWRDPPVDSVEVKCE